MADEIVPADGENVSYLTQIRILDEELERCQLRCDELKKQTHDLSFLYGAVEKNRDDLCDYLIHSSTEAEIRIKELSELLECQQQADKNQTDALKRLLSEQKKELQKEVKESRKRNEAQEKMLEQQQEKKEAMMQKLAHLESIEKRLVTEREEHEAAIARLKSQMDLEQANVFPNQVKSSIRNKVAATVKEERTRHREVFAKVQELVKENGKLLEAAAALKYKESELHFKMENRKMALHKATQDIVRLSTEQEQLPKKCQKLMGQLNGCSRKCQLLLAKELDLRQQLSSKTETCSQMTAAAAQLEAELQEEVSSRRQLEADVQEAANILRPAVMGSEKVSEAQWKKLREILESSASHGTESALYDSPEKRGGGQKPQTSGPGPVSTERLNLATDPLFLLVRYRPGDLSFVPRPTWKSRAATSAHLQAAASLQEILLSQGIHDSL